jgi:hypothetical protein
VRYSQLGEKVDPIILADRGCSTFVEDIKEAHSVGFAGELVDVCFVGPVEGGYLVVAEQAGSRATGPVQGEAIGHATDTATPVGIMMMCPNVSKRLAYWA